MNTSLTGISSMATRPLLAELARDYQRLGGVCVGFESVGGVDAARRVRAGEAFDVVVLAADGIAALAAEGRVVRESCAPLVHSEVAIAVRAGSPRPAVDSEAALRQALLAAPRIGYSTGPSGTALQALIARWGLAEALAGRLVQARPGVPVGSLLAQGEVELGFQQRSELMHVAGIELLGAMPPGTEIVTTFSAATCAASAQPLAAQDLIAFLCSADAAPAKRRQGMTPA